MLTFGSLFSGIGAFDLALEDAGMSPAWQCEIDPKCRSVLAHHWPAVERINDVNMVRTILESKNHARIAATLVRPDIICGGFPCQDVSVAGRRAGLAGSRSGLWFVFRRIIGLVRPRWVLVENVPGLLSSNGGRDMGVILRSLGNMGYGWSYRVLDAQWFGVPQRRRRVFIVGCLGGGRRAAEVLFESNSLPWDSPPRRETGAKNADCLTAGVAASRGVNRPGRRREDDVNLVAATLNSGGNSGGFRSEPGEHLVAHTLRAEEFDASEDGTGRGIPLVPVAYVPFARSGVRRLTPRECERLQGFPDDFTSHGEDGRMLSDSARYRMLGNSIAVPVARWIAERIAATLTESKP